MATKRRRGEEPRTGFLFLILALGAAILVGKAVTSTKSALKGSS